MNEVVIGIGSNIDPQTNIARALKTLSAHLNIVRQSPVVQTQPLGMTECCDFENTALFAQTYMSQDDLQKTLKSIEQGQGRPRDHDKHAPRTIDLDILVFNQTIVDQDVYSRPFLKEAVHYLIPEVV